MTPPPIGPYKLRVAEVFTLANGVNVLVGELECGAPPLLAPCVAELIVNGRSRGKVRVDAERMPGPGSVGRRAVETYARVSKADVEEGDCVLVHRPA